MIGALQLILRRLRPLLPAALVLFLASSLSAQASLEGTVLDNGAEYLGNGATAVEHARVELIDAADSTRHFSDFTDSEGRYFIPISTTGVQEPAIVPAAMALHQNYPNPFNPETRIRFALPSQGQVRVRVFDVLGKQVASLADGLYAAGEHIVTFSGKDLPSGIYFCTLESAGAHEIRKMMLIK